MMQLYKLQLKVAVGAEYIITQLGFNLRKLYELKQYMDRQGLGDIPVLANIYVPTAKVAQMMQAGEVAGCVVTDDFIRQLEKEKKPQRLERAALMLAAVRDLGFAGAHIGGFGLTCKDFLTIREKAAEIGANWRSRMHELVFPFAGEFYLLPAGEGGLSDGKGAYQVTRIKPHATFSQRISQTAHRYLIRDGSLGARFFRPRLGTSTPQSEGDGWRHGFWYKLLELSSLYRKTTLGCVGCGDCLQDHLNYSGCSMAWYIRSFATVLAAVRASTAVAKRILSCLASGISSISALWPWAMTRTSSRTYWFHHATGASIRLTPSRTVLPDSITYASVLIWTRLARRPARLRIQNKTKEISPYAHHWRTD